MKVYDRVLKHIAEYKGNDCNLHAVMTRLIMCKKNTSDTTTTITTDHCILAIQSLDDHAIYHCIGYLRCCAEKTEDRVQSDAAASSSMSVEARPHVVPEQTHPDNTPAAYKPILIGHCFVVEREKSGQDRLV